jgi:hypothetical protein
MMETTPKAATAATERGASVQVSGFSVRMVHFFLEPEF